MQNVPRRLEKTLSDMNLFRFIGYSIGMMLVAASIVYDKIPPLVFAFVLWAMCLCFTIAAILAAQLALAVPRYWIAVFTTVPFAIFSFYYALAWAAVARNFFAPA